MRYPERAHVYKEDTFKSYHILIPIRAGMDHKDDKALPHNKIAFPGLELKTFSKVRRYLNHLTYIFDGIFIKYM